MENLANQLSNVSLYDVKKYVRKAQNAMLNVTDMEAKVREATNNEPWGTPTTVMQQIADATNNYQQFHEIMPFVYRRFSEKSASEWRQIYKSLQLLDFLVRNGSERVVDYARSHISVIEMLRHFSYIDSKGVDKGASIRKRSEELVALLNSNKKLRAERKQAKQLNAKTQGISGGAVGSSIGSGSSRFGGFGSSGATGVYANPEFESAEAGFGDAGGFGGSGSRYGGISSETYYRNRAALGSGSAGASSENVLDRTDTDEFEEYEVSGSGTGTTKATDEEEEDEFAEFQSAPTNSSSTTAAKPVTANILDLFDAPTPAFSTTATAAPAGGAFTSTASQSLANGSSLGSLTSNSTSIAASAKPASSVDLFDSLWETSKTYTPKPASSSTLQSTASQPAKDDFLGSAAPSQAPKSNASQNEVVDLLSF